MFHSRPPSKTSPEMKIEHHRCLSTLWCTTEVVHTLTKGRRMSLVRCNWNRSWKKGMRTIFYRNIFLSMLAISTNSSLIIDYVFPSRLFGIKLPTRYWWQPSLHTAWLAFLLLHCTHWHFKSHRSVSGTIAKQLPNNWGDYKCIELIFEYMLW